MNPLRRRGDHEEVRGVGRHALAIAAVGLVLVGVTLTLFELVLLRRELRRSDEMLLHITGIHSAAAVVFHDAPAAEETLAALDVLPNLESVAIFTRDGERLASHERGGGAPVDLAAAADAGTGWLDMVLVAPVVVNGEAVANVVARFDLSPLYTRIAAFAGMYVLSGFGVLAIGLPLWRRLRSQVDLAQARLTRLAHYDPTTGQLNRNAFNRDLKVSVDACPADGQLGLLILDIDDFKDINDRFGHHTGDELLNQFSQRLVRAVRGSDRVYRLGGDEFAVLVQPIASAREAENIALRLFTAFLTPISLHGHRLRPAFSAGICVYPDDATDIETLVAHADTAMYYAKQHGKNTFQRFEPSMNESTLRRLRLQEDLREALRGGDQLMLAYQPQMAADGRTVEAMEALLRWSHPELGPISPTEFIPIAEDCGLVVPLGRWVIQTACATAARWRASAHAPIRIAVNLSVRQMQDRTLLLVIDDALAAHDLAPDALELEITESLLLEDAETNMSLLKTLRSRGIGLAIDDFGKGYSSMSYLHRLPVNRLKIDMSFVHEIPGGGEAITTAIIAMAHSLGLTVIAEGVETRAQLDFLRAAGCDGLQGNLLAPPLTASAADEMLRRQRRPRTSCGVLEAANEG